MDDVFHLYLIFRTEKKTLYPVIIRNPKVGLPAFIVRQVMETIVRLGLFITTDGPLTSVHSAYYLQTRYPQVLIPLPTT